jgi:hypothetical protein
MIDDESLHHFAVALGAPSRFRTHVWTSEEGIGVSRYPPLNDQVQQRTGVWIVRLPQNKQRPTRLLERCFGSGYSEDSLYPSGLVNNRPRGRRPGWCREVSGQAFMPGIVARVRKCVKHNP